MYANFLSTYSDKKCCHTSTTLHTSIARFVSDSCASCYLYSPSSRPTLHLRYGQVEVRGAKLPHEWQICEEVYVVAFFKVMQQQTLGASGKFNYWFVGRQRKNYYK